jgi:hypothetical protein
VLLGACGEASQPEAADPEGTPRSTPTQAIELPPVDGPYDWAVDAADFAANVDNPSFPLVPGTVLVYEGRSDGEREVVTLRVTDQTKEILGVTCTVVRDTVEDGNVWYMGEDTKEYEEGKVVRTEGSWEAGVDGALPGIIMPATPEVGLAYTQEHYAGEAEDKGKVVSLGDHVEVPYGSFDDVIVTEDWTPLEPKVLEHKYYAAGVGVVFEEIVKGGEGVLRLVQVRPAG